MDVFRSKSTVTNQTATTLNGPVTNQYHDYIYRNIGDNSVNLRADGVALPLTSQPTRFQSDIGDGSTTLYLGDGSSLAYRGNSVATVSGAASQAEARFTPGQSPVVTSNTPVNAIIALPPPGFSWIPTAGGSTYASTRLSRCKTAC